MRNLATPQEETAEIDVGRKLRKDDDLVGRVLLDEKVDKSATRLCSLWEPKTLMTCSPHKLHLRRREDMFDPCRIGSIIVGNRKDPA